MSKSPRETKDFCCGYGNKSEIVIIDAFGSVPTLTSRTSDLLV